MHELPWITIEAIPQWVKILDESPHEWQKVVIQGNEYIILFSYH